MAVFAVFEGLAHRETLFGTGAGRLTPVFCSIATHAPNLTVRVVSVLYSPFREVTPYNEGCE
jgi:hypothetical protein